MAFPSIELMFLGGADGTGDHLEHIFGRALMPILHADGNCDDDIGAELASSLSGNGSDESAVAEPARSNLNWFEQSRKSATGANGFDERALPEDDRITCREIGGDDGKRNLHIFKLLGFENAVYEVGEAVIAGKAEAGNAPTREIAKTDGAAGGKNAGERSATGVSRSEDATYTRACDMGNGDVILFQNLKYAQVREAACESAAEGKRDTRRGRLREFSTIVDLFQHG